MNSGESRGPDGYPVEFYKNSPEGIISLDAENPYSIKLLWVTLHNNYPL